ncbi:hypothetical protein [Micromonospora sp. NPDC048063]|uniref:hypothetical protein n=1 Tax=Micromonospora sp. NPDC048063 TaxID=3364256 RepID=UPI00371E135B
MTMLHHHRSRWAVKTAAAVGVLAAVLACEGDPGRVQSDRPAADRQVDPRAERTVTIRVTEATGPYKVWVRAAKVGQDRGDHTRETVAGGEYKQTLSYTSGLRIQITITVTGHADDMYRCEIADGEHRSRERGAGQVQCQLTTQR